MECVLFSEAMETAVGREPINFLCTHELKYLYIYILCENKYIYIYVHIYTFKKYMCMYIMYTILSILQSKKKLGSLTFPKIEKRSPG